jgi:nucleotide-binding universal stress UspA family protein
MIEATRIVVGVGDVVDGVRPLTWAVAEARRRGAEVHAVRAWRDRSQMGAMTGYWRQELADAALQMVVDAFTLGVGGVPRDITVRMIVQEGLPADVLAEYADRETDVLVLGASRHSRLWPLGTDTVRRCVRRAQCLVTVVPPSALARTAPVRKLVRDLQREIEEFEASSH